jgi:anaerobic C4-dicarboxylate transporter
VTAAAGGTDRTRIGLLAGAGAAIVVAIVVLTPRVGPIGTGTMIALVVAVVATRSALQGNRETRLK